MASNCLFVIEIENSYHSYQDKVLLCAGSQSFLYDLPTVSTLLPGQLKLANEPQCCIMHCNTKASGVIHLSQSRVGHAKCFVGNMHDLKFATSYEAKWHVRCISCFASAFTFKIRCL